MSNITLANHNQYMVEAFKWRMHDGSLIYIKDMSTRHLFNVLCMVWNNSVPITYATRLNFKRWLLRFDPNYIKQAIYNILHELKTRKLEGYMLAELLKMEQAWKELYGKDLIE